MIFIIWYRSTYIRFGVIIDLPAWSKHDIGRIIQLIWQYNTFYLDVEYRLFGFIKLAFWCFIYLAEFVPTSLVEKGCGRRLSTHCKVVSLTNSTNNNHHIDIGKLSLVFVLIPLIALDLVLAGVFCRNWRPSFFFFGQKLFALNSDHS